IDPASEDGSQQMPGLQDETHGAPGSSGLLSDVDRPQVPFYSQVAGRLSILTHNSFERKASCSVHLREKVRSWLVEANVQGLSRVFIVRTARELTDNTPQSSHITTIDVHSQLSTQVAISSQGLPAVSPNLARGVLCLGCEVVVLPWQIQ